MKPDDLENLFLKLDDNFDRYHKGETYWRELHAIDKEIAPGSIFIENFHPDPYNPHSELAFYNDESTVVIRLQNKDTADNGMKTLSKVFRGTGTNFTSETVLVGGQTAYQIRSNIDKANWGRLAVFCKYRFDREIPDVEHEGIKADCQKTVSLFTEGTDCAGWDASMGMPAFVSLLGLHGILRPKNHYAADPTRKSAELNAHHKRGVPHLFDDVTIHVAGRKHDVDVNKSGEVVYSSTPYDIGFNPERAAYDESHEGSLLDFGAEMAHMGGNPFSRKLPLSNRLIKLTGLVAGAALVISGDTWPVIAGVVAGTAGLFIGYRNKHWEVVSSLDELRKKYGHRQAAAAEAALKEQLTGPQERSTEAVPDESTEVALRAAMRDNPELREAFSPEKLAELGELVSRTEMDAIKQVAGGGPKPDVQLDVNLAGAFAGLGRIR